MQTAVSDHVVDLDAPIESEAFAIQDVLADITEPVPRILYHYTDASALASIVQSRTLRASHARFLNDTTEVSHGVETVCRLLRRMKDTRFGHFLDVCAETTEQTARELDFYVACFSDDPDMVAQWQGYGSQGAGFAVGFDVSKISRLAQIVHNTHPLPVIYSPQKQRAVTKAIIRRYLDILTKSLAQYPSRRLDVYKHIGSALAAGLIQVLCAFKSERFQHEREWRLVTSSFRYATGVRVQFHGDGGVVVPFIELPLAADPTDALPITHIRVGPTAHHVDVRLGVQMLMSSANTGDFEFSKSTVPLR